MGTEKREAPEAQRNYLCRHYDDCLEAAAMKNLPGLPCWGCQYENDQGGRKRFHKNIDGCWALLHVLFYPCSNKPGKNREHRLFLSDCPPVDGDSETDDSEKRARKSTEEL